MKRCAQARTWILQVSTHTQTQDKTAAENGSNSRRRRRRLRIGWNIIMILN